jgi:Amt family ammonium transporter
LTPVEAAALAAILISPLAGLGLAMMNAGLGRSRSAAHTMLGSLLSMSAGAAAYFLTGAAFLNGSGLTSNWNGHSWGWLGLSGFFLYGVRWEADPAAGLRVLHGMVCASLAALIPLGAGSDRWRLGSATLIGAVLGGVLFPLFGHWTWNEAGWLARLDEIAGLSRGFIDTGGAGAIHVTSGAAAIALVWMLGPRQGKYDSSGLPTAVPGHHAILSLAGASIALIGWLGLNCAGAVLYNHASLPRLAELAVNTILCAAGGAMAAAVLTKSRFGRPDASLCANGWTGGLVASSAVAASVHPAAAVLIGIVAGAMVALAVEAMDLHMAFDDPGGTVAVHFLGGLWGLLAAGLFGTGNAVAQLAGIATALGAMFPLAFATVWATARLAPLRTTPEGDRLGMDLHELGAGAYPEFVTHHEDMWGR